MSVDDKGSFERRAQSIVQLIISSMLVWIGITTVNTSTSVAELKVRLEERSAQSSRDIVDMKQEISQLKVQVTAVALSTATAATAAALAATTAATAATAATGEGKRRK